MLPESIKVKHWNWSKAGAQFHGLTERERRFNKQSLNCEPDRLQSGGFVNCAIHWVRFDYWHLLRLISTSTMAVSQFCTIHWANFSEIISRNQIVITNANSPWIAIHRISTGSSSLELVTHKNAITPIAVNVARLNSIFYFSNCVFVKESSSSRAQQDRSIAGEHSLRTLIWGSKLLKRIAIHPHSEWWVPNRHCQFNWIMIQLVTAVTRGQFSANLSRCNRARWTGLEEVIRESRLWPPELASEVRITH